MELFDLHCDTLVRLGDLKSDLYSQRTAFSLRNFGSFKRLCQTMAVFIPDHIRGEDAMGYFNTYQQYFQELLKRHRDIAEQAVDGNSVEKITKGGKCALILSVESGAVLNGNLDNINCLADGGVRMMTLTWNGENELGSGHDTDKGLTSFGKEAVREMEAHGIAVDVSHINDRGFEDVCDIAKKPFIATHSNLRSVCGHKRNLTENQFKEIVRRDGLVGLNLYHKFLSEDGIGDVNDMFRHVYRMLELGGENVIACGGDLDGADVDASLNAPDKFAATAEHLLRENISQKVVNKIYFQNALNFFKRFYN